MYLLQAARDADGGRRRRRSPSSCLLCAESPEMLEMKLGLSISSRLIAYLPGWASASKASSLSLSFSLSRLHSRWTYEILTNGFIWPARHWTLDEQSTPPGIWRGGCGAGLHHLERCENICWANSTLRVCVCALCSYFIYVYVQKSIRSETVRAGYEKSFYAFFPAAKSIFKLFPPPMLDAWAHLFAIIWSVRTWYPCLPARTQEILKRNSIWVARVCPASSGSHRRNTRPNDIDAICDKWPHMNNKSCDWCAVSRNTLTAF